MSSDTDAPVDAGAASVEDLHAQVQTLQQEVSNLRKTTDDDGQKSMIIIVTKGTLDIAYPPPILASTTTAFGWDIMVFHTFRGLDILHEKKSKNLELSAVGNPSMSIPNAVAALSFIGSVVTSTVKEKAQKDGTATVEELTETSLDTGVDLQACQMTIELVGYDEAEFYDGVTTGVGAATALQRTIDADVQFMI